MSGKVEEAAEVPLFDVIPIELRHAHVISKVHVATWQTAYRGQIPDKVLDSLTVEARQARWERILSVDKPTSWGFMAVPRDADSTQVAWGFAGGGPQRLPPAPSEGAAVANDGGDTKADEEDEVGGAKKGKEEEEEEEEGWPSNMKEDIVGRSDLARYDGELYGIYVATEAQRKGVGKALVRAVLRKLESVGLTSAVVWVLASNAPARRFYERMGAVLLKGVTKRVAKSGKHPFVLDEVAYVWTSIKAA